MSNLTIRNLDPSVKQALRLQAAARGVSMEQEARDRLAASFGPLKRREPIFDKLTQLGAKPTEAFDQKKMTDELWDEALRWPATS